MSAIAEYIGVVYSGDGYVQGIMPQTGVVAPSSVPLAPAPLEPQATSENSGIVAALLSSLVSGLATGGAGALASAAGAVVSAVPALSGEAVDGLLTGTSNALISGLIDGVLGNANSASFDAISDALMSEGDKMDALVEELKKVVKSLDALAQAEHVVQCPHTGDYIFTRSFQRSGGAKT